MGTRIWCLVFVIAACGGSKHPAGPSCGATGGACTADGDCCTNHCDPLVMQCSHAAGQCLMSGAPCSVGPDCCSFQCSADFKCSGNQCKSDGAACGANGECCGGLCSGGTCQALNPSCKTSGNSCTQNGDCCSTLCNNGTCDSAVSFCTVQGDACTTDAECCSGLCQKSGTATLGTCEQVPSSGATGCATAGEICGAGASYVPGTALPTCGGECCSRACFPGPSGALICQPPSGCRPRGELCTQDSDCCGGPGQPDNATAHTMCRKDPGFTVGRCDGGNACDPAGTICRLQTNSCNATDNCCAGNVQQFNTCHQDNLGIPRCGGAGIDCSNPASKAGMTCATSADCCGLPCVNGICGATCVATGGACTTTADCCSGEPCTIPGGQTTGTCGTMTGCAQYGQACTTAADCCNMVPCTNGTCQAIQ